jgi:hypothetical protein
MTENGTGMRRISRSSLTLAALSVGVAAFIISLGRLWLGDHSALTEVIWAEDGVFPLCIEKAGFLQCLTDPFAGYLLVLPRLLAGIVTLFPLEQWALVTNILGGLVAGIACALAFVIMRRFGCGLIVAVLIGILPVIAPIVGLEAINALGSTYMLLLYVATLALAFPSPERSRSWLSIVAVTLLLLLTSLTIPLAGILLAILIVQAIRRAITVRAAAIWVAAILVGLIAQVVTASGAEKPREIAMSSDTISAWLHSVPDTMLTFWPGLNLAEFQLFGVFPVSPLGATGLLVVIALTVVSIWCWVRGGDRRVGIAALLLTGLAYGAVPSVIGWANNRYFVVPLLLWAAALLVALDHRIQRTRLWVLGLIAIVVIVIWWPLIPASWFRATPQPTWSSEVARVKASCIQDPAKSERPIFSPFWPPNWGDGLSEPTHPNVPCLVIYKLK